MAQPPNRIGTDLKDVQRAYMRYRAAELCELSLSLRIAARAQAKYSRDTIAAANLVIHQSERLLLQRAARLSQSRVAGPTSRCARRSALPHDSGRSHPGSS